jgi:hypothetical protein
LLISFLKEGGKIKDFRHGGEGGRRDKGKLGGSSVPGEIQVLIQ